MGVTNQSYSKQVHGDACLFGGCARRTTCTVAPPGVVLCWLGGAVVLWCSVSFGVWLFFFFFLPGVLSVERDARCSESLLRWMKKLLQLYQVPDVTTSTRNVCASNPNTLLPANTSRTFIRSKELAIPTSTSTSPHKRVTPEPRIYLDTHDSVWVISLPHNINSQIQTTGWNCCPEETRSKAEPCRPRCSPTQYCQTTDWTQNAPSDLHGRQV
jgi:hypothetical protein